MDASFLQLPLEIRLCIYDLILPRSIDCRIEFASNAALDVAFQVRRNRRLTPGGSEECAVRWIPGLCPSILFVNRQLYREASEILYSQNAFEIYVKHPKEPRLPMNDGRVDEASFVLIAFKDSHWCHPRQPKLPLSALHAHTGFSRVRKWHVSLPPLEDLVGVDIYMRMSSFAAFHGIIKWVDHCRKNNGSLDDQEKSRMVYVQQFKHPIDEVAQFLGTSEKVDQLGLTFQLGRMDLCCLEYLLEGFLNLANVKAARCFCRLLPYSRIRSADEHPTRHAINRIEQKLTAAKTSVSKDSETKLWSDAFEMFKMLTAIRSRQMVDEIADPIAA